METRMFICRANMPTHKRDLTCWAGTPRAEQEAAGPTEDQNHLKVSPGYAGQTVLGSKKLWSRGSCPATSCSCQDWNSRRRQGQGIYAKNIKEKFYTESWHWLTTLLQSMMRRFLKESQTNLLLKKWSSIPM